MFYGMALDNVVRNIGRYYDTNIIIANPAIADRFIQLLRERKVWDYVKEVSGKNRRAASVESAVYAALKPTEAHGSGMGQEKTIAIVLKDLGRLSVDEIASIQTRFHYGGFTDFSSQRREADQVFYVADSTQDVDKFREPYLFPPEESKLLTKDGLVPLYTKEQLAFSYLRLVQRRMKPEYFEFSRWYHREPKKHSIEKTLNVFLKLKQFAAQRGVARLREMLPVIEKDFYQMLDSALAEFKGKGKGVLDDLAKDIKIFLEQYRYTTTSRFSYFFIKPEYDSKYRSWLNSLNMILTIMKERGLQGQPITKEIEAQYERLKNYKLPEREPRKDF